SGWTGAATPRRNGPAHDTWHGNDPGSWHSCHVPLRFPGRAAEVIAHRHPRPAVETPGRLVLAHPRQTGRELALRQHADLAECPPHRFTPCRVHGVPGRPPRVAD